MNPSGCEAWDDCRARVGALADDAFEWVASEITSRYADRPWISGTLGRLRTRQDGRGHVSFLPAAAANPMDGCFNDHVRWLSAVQKRRGAPVQTLGESPTLLRALFLSWRDPDKPDRRDLALDRRQCVGYGRRQSRCGGILSGGAHHPPG